jgi:formate/nitrite transporter FocA (FNT family)
MFNRKSLIPSIVAPLIVGLVGLINLMNRPRFASIHNVDVLQLLVSGMCFGVALAMLIAHLRGSRNS